MRTRPPTGFSTLEILIALTVLVLSISAVLLMQPQSSVDTQTESEALNQAQEMLEHTQALARKDFKIKQHLAQNSTRLCFGLIKRLQGSILLR